MGGLMITSFQAGRADQDRRDRANMPGNSPFWELEALIAHGCDLDTALVLMSSRRVRDDVATLWVDAGLEPAARRARLAS